MTAALYVVSTPIGNLADISARAISVLKQVDLIAAEDTRHSKKLLDHLGISTRMVAFHEHNEREKLDSVLQWIGEGKSVALISDAGTPLISDPGYHLVREAHEKGVKVVPVPGVSAIITALSVSGLPTDRFTFEGFLPAKSAARRKKLEELMVESRTMVFYESPHRIKGMLADLAQEFGEERSVVLARELTKKFETVLTGTVSALISKLDEDENQTRGEFVVMVEGQKLTSSDMAVLEPRKMLIRLLKEVSVKTAASIVADLLGENKKQMYNLALEIQGKR